MEDYGKSNNASTADNKTIFVPAICSQCGAVLKVNPTQDAAICVHCGTPFIVEKAIQQFEIQKAENVQIHHAETINVVNNYTDRSVHSHETKGAVQATLDFIDKQIEKHEIKSEIRRQKLEEEYRKEQERIAAEEAKKKKEEEEMAGFKAALFIIFIVVALLYSGCESCFSNTSSMSPVEHTSYICAP